MTVARKIKRWLGLCRRWALLMIWSLRSGETLFRYVDAMVCKLERRRDHGWDAYFRQQICARRVR